MEKVTEKGFKGVKKNHQLAWLQGGVSKYIESAGYEQKASV